MKVPASVQETCCIGFARLMREHLVLTFPGRGRTCYRIKVRGRLRIRIRFCPVCGVKLPTSPPTQSTAGFGEEEPVLWRRSEARSDVPASFVGYRGRISARIRVGDSWHTVPVSSLFPAVRAEGVAGPAVL